MTFILGALLLVGLSSVMLTAITAGLLKWQLQKRLGRNVAYKALAISQLKAVSCGMVIGIAIQNIAKLQAFISTGNMGQSSWGFLAGVVAWYFLTPIFLQQSPSIKLADLSRAAIKKAATAVIGFSFLAAVLIGLALGGIMKLIEAPNQIAAETTKEALNSPPKQPPPLQQDVAANRSQNAPMAFKKAAPEEPSPTFADLPRYKRKEGSEARRDVAALYPNAAEWIRNNPNHSRLNKENTLKIIFIGIAGVLAMIGLIFSRRRRTRSRHNEDTEQ